MNERDVIGTLQVLDEDRLALNRRVLSHRYRLVQRLRGQLIDRAPQRAITDEAANQYTGFARWLESCKTLERTYRDERHGGHSREWAARATAKEVGLLRSGSLRQVLSDGNELYVESPDWVLRELETQLNRWRTLTLATVPFWIHVQYETLPVNDRELQTVHPHDAFTLSFTLTENGEQLA